MFISPALNVLKIHSIDENHGFNSNAANKIFYIIYFLISSIILFSKIANMITQIYHIIQLIF